MQTQNKVSGAISLLPQQVQAQGVTVAKSNDSFLLVVGFYSEDGSFSQGELGDLMVTNFREPLSRINGSAILPCSEQHAMRIWLDPERLYSYQMTPLDVFAALEAQNIDVSAGQRRTARGTRAQINASIIAQSRLETAEQFENIILRANTGGSMVRLKDVARVELGAESHARQVRYKGACRRLVSRVSLANGANALDVAEEVKAKVEELSQFLPEGIKYNYPYDTTPFIKLSIESVVKPCSEVVGLVFLVMLLFLQNFRATLIPTIAVPVVLLGTFAILNVFGYSINT